jgi:hypothetical protein
MVHLERETSSQLFETLADWNKQHIPYFQKPSFSSITATYASKGLRIEEAAGD